nr:hypothetical protein [Tanacetum cinerariifolium]
MYLLYFFSFFTPSLPFIPTSIKHVGQKAPPTDPQPPQQPWHSGQFQYHSPQQPLPLQYFDQHLPPPPSYAATTPPPVSDTEREKCINSLCVREETHQNPPKPTK